MIAENDGDIDYEAIRRRVNRQLIRWGSLAVHGVIWIVGSGLAAIWFDEAGVVPLVWFGIISLHAVIVLLLQVRDALLRREIERERQFYYRAEKAKRDERLRLSDDGELVDFDMAALEEEHTQRQRR